MESYTNLPCGTRMPSSVHAVSVSLPSLRNLVAYEEQQPEILQRVKSGYPRFHTHPYVVQLQEHVARENGFAGRQLLTVATARALADLCAYAGIDRPEAIPYRGFTVLALPENGVSIKAARAFLQHTGTGISSRRAEECLVAEGLLASAAEEARREGDGAAFVRRALGEAYGAGPDDVLLGSFGMNAVYATYRAIGQIQESAGRREWIRFGWIFMDSIQIINKLPAPGAQNHEIGSTLQPEALEAILRERGDRVAGILTEAPSNPMMQTPDLARLRALADRHGCALVIDATLGTPHNVDVLPYADVVVESLTKYASGSADVMAGAVVLNPRSRFREGVRAAGGEFLAPIHEADAARLAHQIAGYGARMKKVNENTLALVELFEKHRSVRRTRWAYAPESRANYEKIHRAPRSPGGIMTLELSAPLEQIYDRLPLAKGPSLGAEFTLVGPYLYHAHYDLVSTESGRALLSRHGLDPNLLRVSVGVEDTEALLRTFSATL